MVEGRDGEDRTLLGYPFHQQVHGFPTTLGFWLEAKVMKANPLPSMGSHFREKPFQREAISADGIEDKSAHYRLHTMVFRET